MNDLQVVAKQEVGSIKWNFEELKQELSKEMESYKTVVCEDSNIGNAKKDIAGLRKLLKEVDDKRKEIKNVCLEPYNLFERQANELKNIINEPIAMIDEKVKDYEQRRKEAILTAIRKYYADSTGSLPEQLKEKVFKKIYSDKWLNATTTAKQWKEEVEAGINSVLSDLSTIKTMQSDFVNETVEKYEETLDINVSLQYMSRLQKEQQLVREREQERIRKEEQERITKELEEKARLERESAESSTPKETEQISTHTEKEPEPIVEAPKSQESTETSFMVKLNTEADLVKVIEFLDFNEITYEVIK